MQIRRALLEEWLRDRYFEAEIDLGSSGVQPFNVGDLLALSGIPRLETITLGDGHALGRQSLRHEIAARWGAANANEVMITNGSSEAIFLVMASLLTTGDEVVVLDPIYHSLASIAESVGCVLRPWELRFANRFKPDMDVGLRLIGPHTRMVVLNFPHNPTGTTIAEDQLRLIMSRSEAVGAWLVLDEAFSGLEWIESTADAIAPREHHHVIRLGTLSKAFGLPGLRVGWCIARAQVLARILPLKDAVSLFVSPLVEALGEVAVKHADRLLNPRRAQARRNLDVLREWMAMYEDRIGWVPPEGGVTVFPRLYGVPDVNGLCERLLRRFGTLLIPGSCFGHTDHIRVGFGGEANSFDSGLERLSLALAEEPA